MTGDNITNIILAVIAAISAGAAVTFYVKSKKSNKSIIKGNKVGGDLAGRDIKKK
ncbi:LPXTG cell wall anchor domain-containing protein [Chryseolinea soli]|uniref:LPXTG cell wall anchor domain-containing protein n=1 Tax=Chryseolinea soli TaxID=2321403 RepID=A0A385SR01_9BACT|nr:LPXTG cell wall anchor domain-containing protein [Chryseolinea soli]AYB32385.1 LPXTG cell wall anchor domain-containing protein [Chryseolinea soli]